MKHEEMFTAGGKGGKRHCTVCVSLIEFNDSDVQEW